MKKFASIALALMLALTAFSGIALAQTPEVTVYLNGAELKFDTEPTIIDGSTMVPLRGIFEALGYTVIWDAAQSLAAAYKKDSGDGSAIVVQVGSNTMYVGTCTELETNVLTNEEYAHTLSVAPVIQNGRVLVPLRALSEASGADVAWNQDTYTVNIYTNIMMSDYIIAQTTSGEEYKGSANYVLGSGLLKQSIKAITFLDTLSAKPSDAWDVSRDKNGSVWAWVGDDGGLYIAGDGGVCAPEDCCYLFSYYKNVAQINFNNCFCTSKAIDMHNMFFNSNFTSINLGDKFNTSNVIDMSQMFAGCVYLTSLNLGDNFDTSNVTDMQQMFSYCKSLGSLNLGDNFATSKVTDMKYMFNHCETLASLDLGDKFDTAKVTDMTRMFSDMYVAAGPILGNKFDTSEVTDMSYMFYHCSFSSLDLGDKFNTGKVTDMQQMFSGDEYLKTINYGSSLFVTQQANTNFMFADCPANKPADWKS